MKQLSKKYIAIFMNPSFYMNTHFNIIFSPPKNDELCNFCQLQKKSKINN
eukprot:UN01953